MSMGEGLGVGFMCVGGGFPVEKERKTGRVWGGWGGGMGKGKGTGNLKSMLTHS